VESLEVDGIPVPVRRSERARRVRLVARPDRGVELVLPARGGESVGRNLVDTHRDWITHQRARLERRTLDLERRGVVWRAGEAIPVTLRNGPRARIITGEQREFGAVTLTAPDLESATRLVEQWYRETARDHALARLEELPVPTPERLRITDTSSRWGSCSPSGTISLSWRLLLAPAAVFDYVVIHEATHLAHLDHSTAFWSSLEHTLPIWRAPHEWLRDHGHELHAYDPSVALRPTLVAA